MNAARDTRVDFSCSPRRHLSIFLVLEEDATDGFHGVCLVATVPGTLRGTEPVSTAAVSLRLPAGFITCRHKPPTPPCASLCPAVREQIPDSAALRSWAVRICHRSPRRGRTVLCACGDAPSRKPGGPSSRPRLWPPHLAPADAAEARARRRVLRAPSAPRAFAPAAPAAWATLLPYFHLVDSFLS